jgi:hypothetical protein
VYTFPLVLSLFIFGRDGGSRTHTPVRAEDFKSAVSTVPPHPCMALRNEA